MPAKVRTAKARRPQFDRAIVELFRKLEAGSERGVSYAPGEKVLMRELGLIDAWWGGVTVTGRTKSPRPWLYAYQSWLRCQEVRRELLAAVEELELEEERAASGSVAAPTRAQ